MAQQVNTYGVRPGSRASYFLTRAAQSLKTIKNLHKIVTQLNVEQRRSGIYLLQYTFRHNTVTESETSVKIINMEKVDLFKAFFTQEGNYYADKLYKYEHGTKYSFNFWAGFLGLIWFCYRKLYVQAIVILLLTFVLAIVTTFVISFLIPDEQIIAPYNNAIIWTLSFFILGFVGNTLYIKKSKEVVEDFISKREIENINITMTAELREKGGTSITAALVCAGIMIALQIISRLIT
jgi:hypothetical protein